MIVVPNEEGGLEPVRTITGLCICMDYQKLNKMKKDHFKMSFIDQMLDRLTVCGCYCFLDGYFGYHQILITCKDQEKMTFTCLYDTFLFLKNVICLMQCTDNALEMYVVNIC